MALWLALGLSQHGGGGGPHCIRCLLCGSESQAKTGGFWSLYDRHQSPLALEPVSIFYKVETVRSSCLTLMCQSLWLGSYIFILIVCMRVFLEQNNFRIIIFIKVNLLQDDFGTHFRIHQGKQASIAPKLWNLLTSATGRVLYNLCRSPLIHGTSVVSVTQYKLTF